MKIHQHAFSHLIISTSFIAKPNFEHTNDLSVSVLDYLFSSFKSGARSVCMLLPEFVDYPRLTHLLANSSRKRKIQQVMSWLV